MSFCFFMFAVFTLLHLHDGRYVEAACSGGVSVNSDQLQILRPWWILATGRTLPSAKTCPCSERPLFCDDSGDIVGLELNVNGDPSPTSFVIPVVLSPVPTLKTLWMSGLGIGGIVPANLSDMFPHLEVLKLYENFLTGRIPLMSKLTELVVNRNSFTRLPNVTEMTALTRLVASNNELEGNLPDFSPLEQLREVRLTQNRLTGSLPEAGMLPASVERFEVGGNQLSGRIPDGFLEIGLEDCKLTDARVAFSEDNCFACLQDVDLADTTGEGRCLLRRCVPEPLCEQDEDTSTTSTSRSTVQSSVSTATTSATKVTDTGAAVTPSMTLENLSTSSSNSQTTLRDRESPLTDDMDDETQIVEEDDEDGSFVSTLENNIVLYGSGGGALICMCCALLILALLVKKRRKSRKKRSSAQPSLALKATQYSRAPVRQRSQRSRRSLRLSTHSRSNSRRNSQHYVEVPQSNYVVAPSKPQPSSSTPATHYVALSQTPAPSEPSYSTFQPASAVKNDDDPVAAQSPLSQPYSTFQRAENNYDDPTPAIANATGDDGYSPIPQDAARMNTNLSLQYETGAIGFDKTVKL